MSFGQEFINPRYSLGLMEFRSSEIKRYIYGLFSSCSQIIFDSLLAISFRTFNFPPHPVNTHIWRFIFLWPQDRNIGLKVAGQNHCGGELVIFWWVLCVRLDD